MPLSTCLLLLVTGLVWCMELVNSAIGSHYCWFPVVERITLAKVARTLRQQQLSYNPSRFSVGFIVLGPKAWQVLATLFGLSYRKKCETWVIKHSNQGLWPLLVVLMWLNPTYFESFCGAKIAVYSDKARIRNRIQGLDQWPSPKLILHYYFPGIHKA